MTSRKPINSIVVIGAGQMGGGIAQVAAQNGVKVVLVDQNEDACQKGLKAIEKSLARVARKVHPDSAAEQKDLIAATMSNLTTSTSPSSSLTSNPSKPPSLVIEAILENLDAKHSLFSTLDSVASPETIFASNTSSLKIGDIAKSVGEARRKQFAGLHFFNPVASMKLVEVIKTEETNQETVDALLELCAKMKKVPAQCQDTPGFIVNRLLVPYLLSAMRMASRGEASPKDIDAAMKYGAGYPMGPFELADYVGLDTMKFISDGWRESRVQTGEISEEEVKSVEELNRLVGEGKLGRKSGEGFYTYDK